MTRRKGTLSVIAGRSEARPNLTASERRRITALATAAIAADQAAVTANERRMGSWGECQRLNRLAVDARGLHFGLANEARRVRAGADNAKAALRDAAADLYRTWRREHPQAAAADHERFLVELAGLCGVAPRDLLRLCRYRMDRRTAEERDQDFELYSAGRSMYSIAKTRGIRIRAVQKDIHARLGRQVKARLSRQLDTSAAAIEMLGANDAVADGPLPDRPRTDGAHHPDARRH